MKFDAVLRGGGLFCVYQPIVDVDTGSVLAYEALLRGPAESAWSPLALLDAAREAGRLTDLERASLRASLTDAAVLTGGRPTTLFVNLEPCTMTRHLDVVLEVLASRAPQIQVVVEVTERALATDLAGVLTAAEALRAAGCAIALDDVGAQPESLAFIPLLRPEVVKLDLRLLRTIKDPATVAVAGAVRAYAEQAGAEVIAEGIESPEDLTRALVLGATLGQGWLWSRGERRFAGADFRPGRFAARPIGAALQATPYELVGAGKGARRAPKHLLVPLAKTVELMALQAAVPPVVLAGFQQAQFFRPSTVRRYTELAASLPFVAALGVDIPPMPAPGVRGGSLALDDPLADEWTIVVLGAHTSVALIAHDRGDVCADGDRQFDFVVSYDRALVTSAAYAMVGRLKSR